MRGNSTPEPQPWWELTLDWPVEHVPCQVVVVEPRRLHALEWALLRVRESFGEESPSLEETAEELGLGEPRFLADTLRSLVTLQALSPRPGVPRALQLSDTLFTERGQELFRKGQIDGQPTTQGLPLCFDPFTDEALPRPEKTVATPRCPVVAPDSLPPVREELGLDRVRKVIHQLGISVGGANAWIRSARVLPQAEAPVGLRGGHHWIGHPVAFVPMPEGHFALRTPTLSAEQRRWLLDQRLDSWTDGSRSITHAWPLQRTFRRSRQPLAVWRETVEQLLPVSQVATEALRLIASARREVLLHVSWAAAPGVRKALSDAAEGGIAVHVLGAESTRVTTWSTAPQRAPGFVVEAGFAGEVSPALVVDGSEALLLDEVLAGVEEFAPQAFEVAGRTRARASVLHQELRRALLGVLPAHGAEASPPFDVRRVRPVDAQALFREPALQLALARLQLFPDPATWAGIVTLVAARYPGAERVEALQLVAEVTGRLAPESTVAPWRQAAPEAWRALLGALSTEIPEAIPDDVLRALFRLAPPQVKPPEAVDRLVEHWLTPAPATRTPEPLRELSRLRSFAEARWQEGAVLSCPGFCAALTECLEVVAPVPEGQALATLAALIGRSAPAEQARRWGEAVADQWPAPRDFHDFEAWRQRHEPLRNLLGPELSRRLEARWRALAQALRARTAEALVEPLRHARGVLGAHEAEEALLAAVESPKLVDKVRHLAALRIAFGRVWKDGAPKPEAWDQRLQRLLSVPLGGFNTEEHEPLVAEVARELQGWPGAEAVLRGWVRSLVETLQPPLLVASMTWWLESLRGVSRFLGPDLARLASEQVRRHAGALREARHRNEPVWWQVAEAWRELGLDAATLDALLTPPPMAQGTPQDKNRRKKR